MNNYYAPSGNARTSILEERPSPYRAFNEPVFGSRMEVRDGIPRNSIDSYHIREASIGSAQIGTASISAAHIVDASITAAKIGELTWDVAEGGTATLGGVDDGDGVLVVKDATGATKVTMDKNGIAVTDGKISLQTAAGTTFIGENGLISTANFVNNAVSGTSTVSTSGTAYGTLAGLSIVTGTLTGNILALIDLNTYSNLNGGAGFDTQVDYRIRINGTVHSTAFITNRSTSNSYFSDSTSLVGTVPAGVGTIDVVWKTTQHSGSGTASNYNRTLSVTLLGG